MLRDARVEVIPPNERIDLPRGSNRSGNTGGVNDYVD